MRKWFFSNNLGAIMGLTITVGRSGLFLAGFILPFLYQKF